MEPDTLLAQWRDECGQVGEARGVDDDAVERVADAGAPRLGVEDDAAPHVEVAVLVEVTVHHAGARLDDRHFGVVADKLYQPLAATGNAEVDVVHGGEHLTRCLMRERQQFDGRRVDALLAQHLLDKADARPTRCFGVFSTFQHAGVATLEAQREHVEGDVGPRLIDHAYDAERHTHPPQMEAVGQRLLLQRAAERRGQRGHMTHVSGYAL